MAKKPDIAREPFVAARLEMDVASASATLDRWLNQWLSKYVLRQDIGAILGVSISAISMFLPWLFVGIVRSAEPSLPLDPRTTMPIGLIAGSYGSHSFLSLLMTDSVFRGPLLVFLAGTIIAVFTRIGGLVQGFGLVGFAMAVQTRWVDYTVNMVFGRPHFGYSFAFMIGYFVALISTLIVMFGGHKFAWNSRNYGNVPANGRTTALLPHATRIMR